MLRMNNKTGKIMRFFTNKSILYKNSPNKFEWRFDKIKSFFINIYLPYIPSAPIIQLMNQAFQLFQLQKVDSHIDQLEQRILEISRILNGNKLIQNAKEALLNAEQNLEKNNQVLRGIEDEIQSLRIKLEVNQASLYGGKIQNPKELKGLQDESASLKKRISSLEDEQLDAMIVCEDVETKTALAKSGVLNAEAEFMNQSASLRGEQSQFQKTTDNLLKEKTMVLNSIQPEILNIYQVLRTQKRGVAVASVEDGSCSACGNTLSPSEWQQARSPHQITYCPSCGRILYAG